jgi:hypothetical protein
MSKYAKKFGVNTFGLSTEEHKPSGKASCPVCGTVVAVNQENKLWEHNNKEGWFCQASWKNPSAVALGSIGGSAVSKAKIKASRSNGRLGGRPLKKEEK